MHDCFNSAGGVGLSNLIGVVRTGQVKPLELSRGGGDQRGSLEHQLVQAASALAATDNHNDRAMWIQTESGATRRDVARFEAGSNRSAGNSHVRVLEATGRARESDERAVHKSGEPAVRASWYRI